MKCENYKQYNVLCQTCNYPNKITCNKTFEENTKMQEEAVMERRILETAASSLRKMNNSIKDSNVVINEITFEVEGYRFLAEKFPNLDEFSLRTESGEVIKLASDGTLCRNNGRCLSGCGYCL